MTKSLQVEILRSVLDSKDRACTFFVDPSIFEKVITFIETEIQCSAEGHETSNSNTEQYWCVFRNNKSKKRFIPTAVFVKHKIEKLSDIYGDKTLGHLLDNSDAVYTIYDTPAEIQMFTLKQKN